MLDLHDADRPEPKNLESCVARGRKLGSGKNSRLRQVSASHSFAETA